MEKPKNKNEDKDTHHSGTDTGAEADDEMERIYVIDELSAIRKNHRWKNLPDKLSGTEPLYVPHHR